MTFTPTIAVCISLLALPVMANARAPAPKQKPAVSWSVPVLMYHYIRDLRATPTTTGKNLSVSPVHFSQDLDWLQKNGYTTVTFSDLVAGSALPKKPILLTFDDGYQDAFTQALPQLVMRGMKATFYIITGFVGLPAYVTWDQLTKMHQAGMEIGAHTVDHRNLRAMKAVAQLAEIGNSVKALKTRLGIVATSFAYPSGKYNAISMKILRNLHIPFAVTTHHGVASAKSDPLQVARLRITDKTNLARYFQ